MAALTYYKKAGSPVAEDLLWADVIADDELRPSLESILAYKPAKLILVTMWNKHEALSRVVATLRMPDVTSPVEIDVLYVDKANKRLQVYKALEDDHVKTAITVMANDDISATYNIDDGTSYMSGCTGAYRTEILKSYSFLENFKNEKWGRYILNADDDNFVTRWLVAYQWKTWIEYEHVYEIETTLENTFAPLYYKRSSR
ncbi:hypothetical protein VTG60DRAFT_2301 [Thermothelomyces hinnuleus]